MGGRWLKLFLAAAALLGVAPAAMLYAATRAAPCDSTEVTASIGTSGASPPAGTPPDRLTIVLVGDTGFNPSDAAVDVKGIHNGKAVMSFPDTLAGISRDIDGDLAFANVETVVTDRNDLSPESKGKDAPFHFRSHPAALKALMDVGFNMFALANNHAFDYGAPGIEETLYHFAVANAGRAIAYAGIGSNFEEALHPSCLDLDGTRVAFSAIGIITGDQPQYRAGPKSAGQASYRNRPDFEAVMDKLVAIPADYRILSINYGLEGRVVPDDRQLADWRGFAAEEKGIDLIVGHHPHVAQGVELDGKSLIFYGLGNFLHPGTAEMTRFGLCRDYGLMAKVHLARADGSWRVEAIEAIPLTNTQTRPERFASPEESKKRIYALNHLGAGLGDGKNAKGVRFTPQADGSGLYCAEGAADLGGKLGTLCQGWHPAAEPDKPLADKIADACEGKPFYGRPAAPKRRTPKPLRPVPLPSPFGNFRPF
ncbi:MAG TPA: CapA family protein [Methyloceanibacter sp.]|nr:CapA family protein [Methyloceanibacter sp.]